MAIPTTVKRFYVERLENGVWEHTDYGYCGAEYFNTREEAERNIECVTKNRGGWDPNGWSRMPHRVVEVVYEMVSASADRQGETR